MLNSIMSNSNMGAYAPKQDCSTQKTADESKKRLSIKYDYTYVCCEEEKGMESFKDVWNLILDYCKEHVVDAAFRCFILPIEPISLSKGVATLYVKTVFNKSFIEDNYQDLLKEAFLNVCGFPVTFTILSGDDTEAAALNENRVMITGKGTSAVSKTHYDYTFENFIVGPSNKFAHAAAMAVSITPGKAYNPLFIYGNSGLGKTHLLNAICYEIKDKYPNATIIFTTGEDFTNEFIGHVKNNTMQAFHDKYRNVDVLLVDDIQFIGGKDQTEEEFFHTFNALHEKGKQIVLTADKPPKDMPTLEDRIRSRFEWGLIADVQAPDYETRILIIKRKAELLNLELSNSVVEFIAEKIKKNIRQLESVVRKLNAYYLLDNIPPSIQIAQIAVLDVTSNNKPVQLTVEQIISEVARTTGVPESKITSSEKTGAVSSARKIAMYIIKEMTGLTNKEIGTYFSGRDYSTVIYGISSTKDRLATDASLSKMIEKIIKNVSEN